MEALISRIPGKYAEEQRLLETYRKLGTAPFVALTFFTRHLDVLFFQGPDWARGRYGDLSIYNQFFDKRAAPRTDIRAVSMPPALRTEIALRVARLRGNALRNVVAIIEEEKPHLLMVPHRHVLGVSTSLS